MARDPLDDTVWVGNYDLGGLARLRGAATDRYAVNVFGSKLVNQSVEDIQFDRKAVTSLDWESYPILRFPEVPEIEMALIDRPKEKPWGAGEPSAAVVPSAISNAVFDAVGARVRSVPFTPEKVKAAMQGT